MSFRSSSSALLSSKASSSSSCRGKGKEILKVPRLPHGRRWEAYSVGIGTNEWTVAVLRDGYRVPFHHLPPVSLNLGSFRLAPWGRSVFWHFGRRSPKCSWKELWNLWTSPVWGLQPAVSGGEGDGGLAARHWSVSSQWLRLADEI